MNVQTFEFNLLYSKYTCYYWRNIHNSNHESMSLQQSFQSLRWFTICKRKLIETRPLFEVQNFLLPDSVHLDSSLQMTAKWTWIHLMGDAKKKITAAFNRMCLELFGAALQCHFEVVPLWRWPISQKYSSAPVEWWLELSLWVDCGVFACSIHDRDGGDFLHSDPRAFPSLRRV